MKLDILNSKKNNPQKFINILFIVFSIGMVMLLFSKNTNSSNNISLKDEKSKDYNTNEVVEINDPYYDEMEERIEDIFSKIEGVGKVEVLITYSDNGEIVLNKDKPVEKSSTTQEDYQGGSSETIENNANETTILVNNSDGSEGPIVIKELVPKVSGIVIIAEGGENVKVKNELINAAKVLLDLPAHKIEVIKMVSN